MACPFPLRLFFLTINLSLVLLCHELFFYHDELFFYRDDWEVNKKLCLLIFGFKMQLHIHNLGKLVSVL